jgi:hypothetical protein
VRKQVISQDFQVFSRRNDKKMEGQEKLSRPSGGGK